ncbi:MAG: M15 family metallopeptidase [Lachnospiraceae bacterium]|nr:M15 family metallopeptidase [Lachnospiraceae bacterium]
MKNFIKAVFSMLFLLGVTFSEFTFMAFGSELPKADPSDWNLILVNKQNFIPKDFDTELAELPDGHLVDKRIVPYLEEMFEAAEREGAPLAICSAYRNYSYQAGLFEKKIRKCVKEGQSYLEAYRNAAFEVTIPGSSEHSLGLALDIVSEAYSTLDSGFEATKQGQWLRENCAKYGFILRYPKEKEYITGITYEPWHFRYVGRDNALYMTENSLVLEEYIELLEKEKED